MPNKQPRKKKRGYVSMDVPPDAKGLLVSKTAVSSPLTKQHLKELRDRGWTVVENAISTKKRKKIKRQWLKTMESYGTGFKADDPSTWTPKTVPPNLRGMQNWPPVAQEPWVWETRLSTAPVFADLWDCEKHNLLSSMDRVCFVPPSRLRTTKTWWHLDQTNTEIRGKLACYQGFVTLEDIGEGEVALEVMSGAHRHHAAFFEEHLSPEARKACQNGNWHKFTPEDRDWYVNHDDVRPERVHMPAGSLVLWDSRLPHHARPPADPKKRSDLARFVIYTCMLPRGDTPEKVLAKRIKAHNEGRAMSHWPNAPKLFALKPRTYGQELPCSNFDVDAMLDRARSKVSDRALMRRLVGY